MFSSPYDLFFGLNLSHHSLKTRLKSQNQISRTYSLHVQMYCAKFDIKMSHLKTYGKVVYVTVESVSENYW